MTVFYDVATILKSVGALTEQEAVLPTGTDLSVRIQYVNDALGEWADAYTWEEIFGKRDLLLQKSDWTVLPDVPLTTTQRQEWITYRSELRTIQDRYSNPNDVVFPTPPAN